MKLSKITLTLALLMCIGTADAAKPKPKRGKKNKTEVEAPKKQEPKKGSIEAVIKDGAKHYNGLLNIVEQSGKFYFLLPTSQLDKDMLLVTRISQASAGLRAGFTGYAGDPVGEDLIRFKLSPDSTKLFLQSISMREIPRDTLGDMYDNVMRSNFQPLAEMMEVSGKNKGMDTLLIDATNFILGDNDFTGISSWIKRSMDLSQFKRDRAYVESIESYPINTEIRTVKTYSYTQKNPWTGQPMPPQPVSFELNTSIIELPEEPMQPRYADERVGYFTENYVDFNKNPQGIKNMSMITRWRLEPKPEDEEAYMRGELVEPQQPIVFYIDPTTPEKWVDYLIQGVNDWEPVFRKAGFKNAIRGERAPVDDPTWSINDARHSAIVYKPSTIPNASGPHVNDPRTGQILESHINWYHNVMLLLRNWYMIQVGPNDPDAQQMTFPDELMGELIRFVSSHEVGHTLGLRHNFGSTSLATVEQLRDPEYLKEYGHTPSIMDYSRFNYVVQPEDNIDRNLLFPRISDYDYWAIEWGYRRFLDKKTADAEATLLNEWIIEETTNNPRLWFGHEMNPNDPRSQSEDLGSNQMEANALGIKNLERVVDGLPKWTATPNEGYDNLSAIYREVITQYGRYIGHVAKWVGGIYENPMTLEQGSEVYSYVSAADQREAMEWLNTYFFTPQKWIQSPEIAAATNLDPLYVASTIYAGNMRKVVNSRVMSNLVEAEASVGSKAYSITSYFADLYKYIFRSAASADQRVMQKVYVETLFSIIPNEERPSPLIYSDVTAMVLRELRSIESKLRSRKASGTVEAAHYRYLADRIKDKLDNQ